MSAFTLKIIAIIAMTIDHAAILFFDNHILLRLIGRLTMPIMAFFAAEGFRHTRNVKKYMLRIFIFALITSAPYMLTFTGYVPNEFVVFNVMYTILFGIAGLFLYCKFKQHSIAAVLMLVLPMLLAAWLESDWSYIGIAFIYAFYFANRDKKKMALFFGVAAVADPLLQCVAYLFGSIGRIELMYSFITLGVLLALPLLYLYNNKLGIRAKYLFYIYYPAHLLILWLIKEYS